MNRLSRLAGWFGVRLGPIALIALGVWVCLPPAWLFADPLRYYYVQGDDWEFIASSRTLVRALENLWTPHNVHVVPVWRIWTALVVLASGRLANLQPVLAGASYLVLVAVMLLSAALVVRETRRMALGLLTLILVGTTSLMQPAGSWFSASQASGAGLGILLTLWFAQGWRLHGGVWRLLAAGVCTWIAGGSWTTGHVAGVVGATYLWVGGRPASRRAALVPLVASMIGVGVALGLGGRGIAEQSTISFHGRKTEEAIAPLRGTLHTIQAVPERLILGDLGLVGETTFPQAAVLFLALAAIWFATHRRVGAPPRPLEAAGVAIVLGSYWMLWLFRAYLPFSSLRGFVPWYETIPQIGLCLFLAGWWDAVHPAMTDVKPSFPTRAAALALILLQLGLVRLHEAHSLELFDDPLRIGGPSDEERPFFSIPANKRLRAVYLWNENARQQRRYLARLDRTEEAARRMGLGREAFVKTFGQVVWPHPPVIDDGNLLDLPWKGRDVDPAKLREMFGETFKLEPEPVFPRILPPQSNAAPPS